MSMGVRHHVGKTRANDGLGTQNKVRLGTRETIKPNWAIFRLRLIPGLSGNLTMVLCPYCQRKLKTAYGLEQHIKATTYCRQMRETFQSIDEGHSPDRKKSRLTSPEKGVLVEKIGHRLGHTKDGLSDKDDVALGKETDDPPGLMGRPLVEEDDDEDPPELLEAEEDEEDDYLFDPYASPATSEAASSSDDEVVQLQPFQVQVGPIDAQAAKIVGKRFTKYVRHSYQHFLDFNDVEVNAVKIMHKLIKKKATLDTYEDVMEWHLRASGKMQPQESLGESKLFVSREKLMKKLKMRYNMDKKYAVPHPIVLPHTSTKLTIWKKFARDNVMSLLTDPRWKDEDWLYFDEDPFAAPPDTCPFVEDLNTGEAYLVTHRRLITKPNQILVALPLYIDGAVTGQYDKLQVTALKMSIGILNRRARDKEYAWRTLGYVPNYTKSDSRGKKILIESGHVAAYELYVDGLSDEDEGVDGTAETDVDKAADYHAILSVLLQSVFALIAEGMIVDIYYKNKLYKDCELVFFVPFVKCDGDEGDKLCCSYRSRTKGVKQLCRYCQCPTASTDDPNADYPMKTEPMMLRLLATNNAAKLKELSQIGIKNAFHGLRFGLHNNRGIHGACPWELLHAILLGIFKYTRDCFFAQMGATSATASEINALAVVLGAHFARQSDRNKPRTKFGKGIMKGKLMAKEFAGVLLIMAAILRCDMGQAILRSARKKNFRQTWQVQDWILLVETLLQWEAYLTLARMEKKHVRRLKKKHRFIMFLLKKVGNRVKGMGFKVMKFHAILHLAFDVMMFGVPMNVDTGSNESHHKTTKVAAKLTQKDIKSFEKQTSNRCDDFHVLDLAMEEINGRPLWEYYSGFVHPTKAEKDPVQTTGGMKMVASEAEGTNTVEFEIITRMKNKESVRVEMGLLEFVLEIQKKLENWFPVLPICAEHSRGGQIFRSHPNYRGKGPWRDWVMVRWDVGDLPAKIWGFLDLSVLPEGTQVSLGVGEKTVEKGVYAIIESAEYTEEDGSGSDAEEGKEPADRPPNPLSIRSDLFKEIMLDTKSIGEDGDIERRYYLVEVEAFVRPMVVIPNIGGTPKCKYFEMAPKTEWSELFATWVDMDHAYDSLEMAPTEPESSEADELESSSNSDAS